MNIVEKKCPNCHANLEFDVGEQNVKCPNCRRAYAIEYDKDFVDPEVRLKAKDIQLKLLDDFEKTRTFSRAMFIIVFALTAGIIVMTIVFAINGYEEYKKTRDEIESSRIESEKRHDEFLKQMQQDQDEGRDMYNKIRDEIDRQTQE